MDHSIFHRLSIMEPPSPAKAQLGQHSRWDLIWRGILVASVFSLGVTAPLAVVQGWLEPEPPMPGLGKPAPQIDLIQLSSDDSFASANLPMKGNVTLLHFWGTWCGACRIEYPELAKATHHLAQDPRFRFVPVTCDPGAGETFEGLWKKTQGYFQSQSIVSAAYVDPRGITRRSAAQRIERNQLYYPASILIGPDGRIVGSWEGYTETSVPQISEKAEMLLSSL
jgi:thiol-disulfide isomerase/thioredoxin